jgi:SAM-dependent methyltransferase
LSADPHGYDPETLAFYEREAGFYANRPHAGQFPWLWRFLEGLPAGASILELGCGGGRDAGEMLRLGYAVTPTDGSPAMVAQAEQRLGRSVRLMRFDELDAEAAYDAVWANAALLHARLAALPGILTAVRRSLKPGGRFFASYKVGDGEDRDQFGRYFSLPPEADLRRAYEAAGPWASLETQAAHGSGFEGVPRDWLAFTAVRG